MNSFVDILTIALGSVLLSIALGKLLGKSSSKRDSFSKAAWIPVRIHSDSRQKQSRVHFKDDEW